MPVPKNSLSIRLTESVVFLRTGDGTGRTRHGTQPSAPPAMVRGLLTLNIAKPTKISSIEVELLGKTSTAWPEGVGARRVEVSEDHKIYLQSYVYFRAGATPHHTHRRTLSVGPGLHLERDRDMERNPDEDDSDESSDFIHEERRGREPIRGQQRGRAPRRLSADQTIHQPGFVSHHNEQLPTPPYSPMYSPSSTPLRRSPAASRAPSIITPIPIDEGFAERDHSITREPSTPRHGSPGFMTPLDGSLSRRVSYDDPRPEFVLGSSMGPSGSQGSSAAHLPYSPTRNNSHESANGAAHASAEDRRGRSKGKRLSSIGMFFDAVKERVRSVSRAEREHVHTPSHSRSRDARDLSPDRRDGSDRRGQTREPRERSTLERVTEVLGLESEEENDSGEGWKEFRKGIYTYPISFAMPSNSPPTLHTEFGAVTWRLRATAHRPGTFTTKFSATQEVTVVACPSEEDTEDSESIIVERQWDNQMQYLIAISGRSFPIGGVMPFSITFVPFSKMKVFRLSLVIEERIEYYTDFKRLVRSDPINRVVLVSLKDQRKEHPILPLSSDDIDAFKGSPLYGTVNSDEDLSEVVANLMGPGPWSIQQDVPLPKSCQELHFTNKNKKSNIIISHTLKVIFRVQRGDDQEVDPQTGKRKMFDIVVQTPIHILSCLCRPDFTALPPYSETPLATSSLVSSAVCACAHAAPRHGGSGDTTPNNHLDVSMLAPDIPFAPRRDVHRYSTGGQHTPTSLDPAQSMFHAHVASAPRAGSATRPVAAQRMESLLEHSSHFERLISGHETESGEAPPAYEQAVGPTPA